MSKRALASWLMAAATATAASTAWGVGALAVGSCGAYGTSYGHDYVDGARRSALRRCGDYDCDVVLTIRNECAAFANSVDDSCGPRGWAYAQSRREAENLAMDFCYRYGGDRCRVRAWVCDDHG
ncbi:DUF4189 domain-containing protein [Dokdonella sp.]|uniref:DUF4189 domain-containing protein n=1 Tax=Dokdonella sp. TaxID=2291710 RepID=UPI001B11E1B4|nr:DUF4189 domain-containing protein [Dokdonella sp.]MBO9664873.1 DUF4189 domain-containing protein [Dokdonella sp.]